MHPTNRSLHCNSRSCSQAATKCCGFPPFWFPISRSLDLFRISDFGFRISGSAGLRFLQLGLLGLTVALTLACSARDGLAAAAVQTPLVLSCQPGNDLYRVLSANGVDCARFDTPKKAIAAATEGAGALILADGYPERTRGE